MEKITRLESYQEKLNKELAILQSRLEETVRVSDDVDRQRKVSNMVVRTTYRNHARTVNLNSAFYGLFRRQMMQGSVLSGGTSLISDILSRFELGTTLVQICC